MNSLLSYFKRFSKVWIYTILTTNVILLIGLPIMMGGQLIDDGTSLPLILLLVFIIASLGALFGSFIPLIVFIFLHSKFNQSENKTKTVVIHTIASTLGYIVAILFVSSFSLKNNNVVLVVAMYHLISIVYLLNDNKKHKLSQKTTEL